ncbi:MAG: thioredoxin domain-containing protein [Chloroflexi bacterium]|nr:thioredoxin domain-containing protein [Chloroflexota bacterium]
MPNRLRHETSPYLRQHANNPVDWYPWGEEALNRAKQEDKPILLSIGYSTCHWCHVMAHESFEQPETARLMNEDFVSIKVDREERPDLDAIYMEAVQALTGQGGWPLTVFLTPDLKPFYGGTYFPPVDRYGLPGFPRLLAEVTEDYRQKRRETQSMADWLTGQLKQSPLRASGQLPDADSLRLALHNLQAAFDQTYGGFGEQPKFPQPAQQELLLRLHARGLDDGALAMVETTLRQIAAGGIHDQIGGGFHRYSVDSQWTVPHFEKMLYDNAQLVRLYARAYLVTGEEDYGDVVEDTLSYLFRELRAPAGGFYAAQDADSPGGEGAFYVWTPDEVKDVLGESEGELACRYFGIDEPGNFEGKSIPTRRREAGAVAAELGIDEEELRARAGTRGPLRFGYWLCAFDFATAMPQELAIVGAPDEPGTRELLAGARGLYRPNLVLVGQEGSENSPLLANRLGAAPASLESEWRGDTAAEPTAYYCANFTCLPPTADPEELRWLLGG